jgi:4'-phosphopantetheinyl transferase
MNLSDVLEGRFGVPNLSTNVVHYLVLPTTVSQADTVRLRNVLDAEERAKADRYRFEKDRAAFTVCRGALRLLLGRYTNTAPPAVRFSYGPHGKPQLASLGSSNLRTSDVRFNVSHSGELTVIGLTLGREIGVDVEFMRPQLDFLSLARTSFSAAEKDLVAKTPLDQQAKVFYEFWSCKEACIKADSRGLGVSLAQFEIGRNGLGSPWRSVSVMPGSTLAPDTRVRALEVGATYAAAVAARGADWDVRLM